MTTIAQWYEEEKKKLADSYQYALKGLEKELHKKQESCGHTNETRYEGLFYALGETYPGIMCDYCGRQRRIDEKPVKPKKKKTFLWPFVEGT